MYCSACRKNVELVTGTECGLGETDTRYDSFIAATACLPCDPEVGLAARAVATRIRRERIQDAKAAARRSARFVS